MERATFLDQATTTEAVKKIARRIEAHEKPFLEAFAVEQERYGQQEWLAMLCIAYLNLRGSQWSSGREVGSGVYRSRYSEAENTAHRLLRYIYGIEDRSLNIPVDPFRVGSWTQQVVREVLDPK